jgi:hypothetical protein
MRYLYSLLAVTFLVACSDEIVHEKAKDIPGVFSDGTVGDTVNTPGDSSTGPEDGDGNVQTYTLKFKQASGDDNVSCANSVHCAIFLSYNSSRSLHVVFKGDDKPLAGRLVSFAIDSDPNDLGHLTAFTAYTDGSGVASIQVKASQAVPGAFVVKASVDEIGVAPLYFDVTITPKGVVPLTVVADYDGTRPLTTYTTKLYLQGEGKPDCADLEQLYSGETAHYQSPPTNLTQSVKFTEFAGLKDSGPQMYTVLAYALNPNGAVWAWGCDATNAEVVYGYSTTVSVDLSDIPPIYKGTYELTSYFDFVSALPDEAEPYVNLILDFFGKPTEALLGLMCMIPADALDEFCGFLFDDEGEPTITGDVVMQVVDAIIVGLTKDTIWGDVMASGMDVASMLQQFEMGGLITFKDQPDASGHWTADLTEESWDTVVVKWSLDANCDPFVDEDCGKLQFSLGAIDQQGTVSGSFTASVANEWDLTIDEHPIDLKYGAILNYVIEAQLLPLMTGWQPGDSFKIDSYEEFLQYVLAGKECFEPGFGKTCCEAFAEDLAQNAGTIGENLAESACELLTDLGAAYIEDALLGLTADTGDAFLIGTATPCKFYDANDDMIVDGFGTKAKMCTWKATIDFGTSATTIDADFFATRLD